MPACAASSSSACSRWCDRSVSGPPNLAGRATPSGWRARPESNWWNVAWCRRSATSRWSASARSTWLPPHEAQTPVASSRRSTSSYVIMMMSHGGHRIPVFRIAKRLWGRKMIKNFLQELRTQRWDDHRYYHHSRINQSLHFVSAASFLVAYVMVFIDPVVSALLGWLVSMTSRQAGHFFFEPRGYDHVNHASHEHKEEIKVGYNLQRKVVLMTIWALSPVVLFFDPTLFGLFTPWTSPADFMRQVAKIWLVVGAGGLLFRTVHLFFIRDVETGLVWMTKILTDPFSDLKLYYKAPLALMKGELIDPGLEKHVKHA